MFGYVRPVRAELKGKDFDLYRATYCGLCRCMRRACGPLAPLFLNFDFTFLALLLWQPEERFTPCTGRCCANRGEDAHVPGQSGAGAGGPGEHDPHLVEAAGQRVRQRLLEGDVRPERRFDCPDGVPPGGEHLSRL